MPAFGRQFLEKLDDFGRLAGLLDMDLELADNLARHVGGQFDKGLNNMPGIHSARYAGDNAGDAENVAKLLKMMSLRSATLRDAQFVCCLVAYDPDGNEHVFHGTMEGEISKKVAGTQGFGYDPIFIPKGETQTNAELGSGYKAKHSHRAAAIRQLAELLS